MRQIKIHDCTLADQDWVRLVIFTNFADRTGLDSILSDQDWTRTEKFHGPLTSARYLILSNCCILTPFIEISKLQF